MGAGKWPFQSGYFFLVRYTVVNDTFKIMNFLLNLGRENMNLCDLFFFFFFFFFFAFYALRYLL